MCPGQDDLTPLSQAARSSGERVLCWLRTPGPQSLDRAATSGALPWRGHGPYASTLRPRAACTRHRTVLATTVEPADDLWLCGGLRFEARTSMCLPCVCSVAERNADIATVWKALSLWRLFCRRVCVRYPGSTVELESHLGCTGPSKLLHLHLV